MATTGTRSLLWPWQEHEEPILAMSSCSFATGTARDQLSIPKRACGMFQIAGTPHLEPPKTLSNDHDQIISNWGCLPDYDLDGIVEDAMI